jgi:hypothetical protein
MKRQRGKEDGVSSYPLPDKKENPMPKSNPQIWNSYNDTFDVPSGEVCQYVLAYLDHELYFYFSTTRDLMLAGF